jgi:hypothetical protein
MPAGRAGPAAGEFVGAPSGRCVAADAAASLAPRSVLYPGIGDMAPPGPRSGDPARGGTEFAEVVLIPVGADPVARGAAAAIVGGAV